MKYIKTFSDNASYEADKTNFEYPHVSYIEGTDSLIYEDEAPPVDWSKEYLTFEAIENGTFSFSNDTNYSLDNGATWTALAANTQTPTVNAGERIKFKGSSTGIFLSTADFNAMGNLYSIKYGDNFSGVTSVGNNEFSNVFKNNTNIVDASNLSLPATTVSQNAYQYMFSGCTSLTHAPELPATTLDERCYESLFAGCTSLTTVPSTLPATTLPARCYTNMFNGCTSLTTAPELPAATLTAYGYQGMFSGCTSLNYIKMLATNTSAYRCLRDWVREVQTTSGTFVKNASMTTLPSGADGIPTNWTVVDAS